MFLGVCRWPFGSPGVRFTVFTIRGALVGAPPSFLGIVQLVSIWLCWGVLLSAAASAAADLGHRFRSVVGGGLWVVKLFFGLINP